VPEQTARPTATAVRWPVPIALAVPAIAAAVVVTFSPGHSAGFGMLVFGGFAVLTAVAAALGAVLLPGGAARTGAIVKAVLAAVGGTLALLLPVDGGAGGAAVLGWTMAGVLAALAVVDIVVGARMRRVDRFGRDWVTTGVVEALGAVVVVAVPPSFFQAFSFSDQGQTISGEVTSTTMMVGLFGAAAAILGVFLAIAGIGLVPSRARATA